MKKPAQPSLFGDDTPPALPPGFKYQPDLLSPADEADLIRHLERLPFKDFEFHGFLGKRRVVSFGWR